jgi:hypothetical protein
MLGKQCLRRVENVLHHFRPLFGLGHRLAAGFTALRYDPAFTLRLHFCRHDTLRFLARAGEASAKGACLIHHHIWL